MPIKACQGCLKDQFLTTVEAVDCFTGKQLWMWGAGSCGELGTNTNTARSSPVQTISAGNNWKLVSLGIGGNTGSVSGGIKQDGSLWMWGNNSIGALGTNNVITRSSPVQTISGGTDWKSISVSSGFAGAIKIDGTLWLWGNGTSGQLGDNTLTNKSSPVQTVSGGTNWRQISTGTFHSSAIKTDGTLWLWGLGTQGSIGNGALLNISSPVQTVLGGTTWCQTSVGGAHSAAIKTDGTLWIWGYNSFGQLGNGTITNTSTPVQVAAGGSAWKSIDLGGGSTSSIKTDGTLWMWGINTGGQLGDNTLTNKSSPVQTISGGTNWRNISAGVFHTLAIKTDGTLWTWGTNTVGGLGNNTTITASSPIQTVSLGNNWKSVSAGGCHSSAIAEIEF